MSLDTTLQLFQLPADTLKQIQDTNRETYRHAFQTLIDERLMLVTHLQEQLGILERQKESLLVDSSLDQYIQWEKNLESQVGTLKKVEETMRSSLQELRENIDRKQLAIEKASIQVQELYKIAASQQARSSNQRDLSHSSGICLSSFSWRVGEGLHNQ